MNKSNSLLAASLQIKPSQLYVRDLQKVGAFYKNAVGLDLLESTDSRWILGHDQTPVLELISKPEFQNTSIRNAGLFHNAILFSSQAALAQAALSVIQQAPESFEGTGDHLVSEAFYFHDPEGNGLELYYDRPRDDWQWVDGHVKMDTLYINPEQYIINNLHGQLDKTRKLGHVHLRVGDIPSARDFYVDKLGFDITADMGSALFVSVGGYHHHMAMNTWMSQGASKRDPALGLADIQLTLPGSDDLLNLTKRLEERQHTFRQKNGNVYVSDPWGNSLIFSVE